MKRNDKIYRIMYRRKREGKTNYKKRLNLLSSHKLRLVIRKSLKNITASIIDYSPKGDVILASASSNELKKMGWKFSSTNLPSAYLTGFLLGNKAKEKGIKSAVLDIGLNKSVTGSKIYACLSGVLDSEIKVPHNPKILPKKERIEGKHISNYASKIKDNKETYEKQFSSLIKENVEISSIDKSFDEIKNKISGGNK